MSGFSARLAAAAEAVETALAAILTDQDVPERLVDAMRHGVLGGGKRFRPFLVMEVAALFGASQAQACRAGAALELVHCYSLVHDDLPSMDNDDIRRGQPTVHRAFDEATAILAGDALLTLAFETLAAIAHDKSAAMVAALAKAAGCAGMVGGQMLDLAAEGRFGEARENEASIRRLQAMKTGALIRVACELGTMLGGANAADSARLKRYGEIIGLAFQIADDLIDLEGDAASAGKATGKDAALGKATLPSLHGTDWAKATLKTLVSEAETLLQPFGNRAETLRDAAAFVAFRTS